MPDDRSQTSPKSNTQLIMRNGGSSSNMINELEGTDGMLKIGRFKFRGETDNLPQNWWVASTAIPLVAATIGPLANVLSISALVTEWRADLPDNGQLPGGTDENGVGIPDPQWQIILNAVSLACGFTGNFFLLLNFTRRVRYIVALPLSIIFWYFATGILIGIIIATNQYVPPIRPAQTYSQGFWSAIIAATLYLIGSMILMINMMGYFLGHYPQHFELDDDQRTLILQSMMFFIWLAGGAGVYEAVCGFSYANALYFCDVTILTIGFGDFVPTNDLGRGLLFPYAVVGIIFLGLMINSLHQFASGMSQEKIVKQHALHQRAATVGRTVTSEKELRDRLGLPPRAERRSSNVATSSEGMVRRSSLNEYGHFVVRGRTITFREKRVKSLGSGGRGGAGRTHTLQTPLSRDAKVRYRADQKSPRAKSIKRREKLILLREEKDRFEAMREIQSNVRKFKQYYALSMSIIAFLVLWCGGAVVFWRAEQREQSLTYFQALYFCYVSLLTIGYGDITPKSNAGKPFFVVWSLVAVPTMTILISDMSSTVVAAINRGTFTLADWTVMPKAGVWHDFLQKHPRLRSWLERKTTERKAKKRIRQGFEIQNPDEEPSATADDPSPALGRLVEEIEEPVEQTEHDLARKLALAIKRVANDLRLEKPKQYSYEEWVEFTRLIRFSTHSSKEVNKEEEEEGLVEWDWIGEDSPMLAGISESEWILDRLCESLNRYTRRQGRSRQHEHPPRHFIEKEMAQKSETHSQFRYPAHPGRRTPSPERKQESGDGIREHAVLRDGSLGVSARKREEDSAGMAAERDANTGASGGKTVIVDDEVESPARFPIESSSSRLGEQFKGEEVRGWVSRMDERDAGS
ncbi:Potassium channel [Clarireedia jacksonii]